MPLYCSNVHGWLVYLACDGFLQCFCLLAESYETVNHYHPDSLLFLDFLLSVGQGAPIQLSLSAWLKPLGL